MTKRDKLYVPKYGYLASYHHFSTNVKSDDMCHLFSYSDPDGLLKVWKNKEPGTYKFIKRDKKETDDRIISKRIEITLILKKEKKS